MLTLDNKLTMDNSEIIRDFKLYIDRFEFEIMYESIVWIYFDGEKLNTQETITDMVREFFLMLDKEEIDRGFMVSDSAIPLLTYHLDIPEVLYSAKEHIGDSIFDVYGVINELRDYFVEILTL